MRRILKVLLISSIILFSGFWAWYEYMYSMDTIIPFEVNNSNKNAKVLIASQGSRFKDSLVQRILRHYEKDSVYFKVIDAYTLFTVNIDKWDAIVIINTWEYSNPPINMQKFIKNHPDKLDKLIILSTVGSRNIILKDIDVISGESIIEKTSEYTDIIIKRLNLIIK